jgi:2,4-dienoyl-CoA reductase (NADPH2)
MGLATEDGYISDENLGFYEAIAKGGVGLVIVEMAFVDYPVGCGSQHDPRIDDDRFIPRLSELAKLIHSHGAATFLQINHCGPNQQLNLGTGRPRASSTLEKDELPAKGLRPTSELTIPEIKGIVEKFGRAAERARKAGFDGVEVHSAHAYLLATFLSGAWNKRQDVYGGSVENRARLACEIIQAIKQRVGPDFVVSIRLNGSEYGMPGGLVLEETQAMCQMMQKVGADTISVSAYGFGPLYNRVSMPEQMYSPEAPIPLGDNLDGRRKGPGGLTLLSEGIKKTVSVPVIAVGRLDPITGEEVLRQGRADFVAIGRHLLCDPDIFKKEMEGRFDEVRPCTACLTCLQSYGAGGKAICRANASLGKEWEYAIKPAEKKKKVMVIGGGPAGMEAARVAALRGHEVMICEREPRLGGAVLVMSVIKNLDVENVDRLIHYFSVQLKRLGVRVRLGAEVNDESIEEFKPDAVIVATGGMPVIPEIPGISSRKVVSQSHLHRKVKFYLRFFRPKLLGRLTKIYLPVGKRVVIIGGGLHGLELAEFLVKRGRRVTVTEVSNDLGPDMIGYTKERVLYWLAKKGCTLLSGVKYESISDNGLTLVTKEGQKQTIEADTILPALGFKPGSAFTESLKDKVSEIYVIGDAKEPRLIVDAVADGFRTALNI